MDALVTHKTLDVKDGLIFGSLDYCMSAIDGSDYKPMPRPGTKISIDLTPYSMIVKCLHCGQFAARYTACKYCGAPVE